MLTKANLYYIWLSKEKISIGGLVKWLSITSASIILGLNGGIQSVNDIQLLWKGSSVQASQNSELHEKNNVSKQIVLLVIGIITLPNIVESIMNFLKNSSENKKASEISEKYLHPKLKEEINSLHSSIRSSLNGDFRVYIGMPYSKKIFFWNYRISFSNPPHSNDRDISIDVNNGELGFLIHNLETLKSQKYVPQVFKLNSQFPLGYNDISQHNKTLINQIFIVQNSAIIGLFDHGYLCGFLAVTTSEESNLSILQNQAFKDKLTAFVQCNEDLISTIWQTTGGKV